MDLRNTDYSKCVCGNIFIPTRHKMLCDECQHKNFKNTAKKLKELLKDENLQEFFRRASERRN